MTRPRGDFDDRRTIETILGLPRRHVKAVERRQNRDYALILDSRRPHAAVGNEQASYRELKRVYSCRVLRLPWRMVHGRSRGWRGRNKKLWWWAFEMLPYGPAAQPERLDRDDRMLDQLRAAIVRASHTGEAARLAREFLRETAA